MPSWYLGSNARLHIVGQGGVNGELWERFVAGCDAHHQATGVRTQVNSVMRSTADQQRFWDAYVRYLQGGPKAPLAARPGTSNHERGLAVDAQPANRGADSRWQQYFRQVGLHFPVHGEPWHVELAPNRKPLPKPIVPEEDIMASLDDLRRVVREEVGRVSADGLTAAVNATRIEAAIALYRTPNGSIYMVTACGERIAPAPAQLAAAVAIRAVPEVGPVQVDQATADHLAALFPLRGR